MNHISTARLFKMRALKRNNIQKLILTERNLKARLDNIRDQLIIERAMLEATNVEIDIRANKEIPSVEIINLGLDDRRRPIYGAKIQFYGINKDFYKIIDSISLSLEEVGSEEWIMVARDWINDWILSERNLSSFIDFDEFEKNIILKNINALNQELYRNERRLESLAPEYE